MDTDNDTKPLETTDATDDLGDWGVPTSLEESAKDAGYPAGIGMPGIFSGDQNEEQSVADDMSVPSTVETNSPS